MLPREKWVGIALLVQAVLDAALYKRLVRRATAATLFVVAAGVMTTIAAVGLFFCLYRWLQRYGMDADMAVLTVTSMVALVAAILVYIAIRRMRHLREVPQAVSDLRDVINAFVEGFTKNS